MNDTNIEGDIHPEDDGRTMKTASEVHKELDDLLLESIRFHIHHWTWFRNLPRIDSVERIRYEAKIELLKKLLRREVLRIDPA